MRCTIESFYKMLEDEIDTLFYKDKLNNKLYSQQDKLAISLFFTRLKLKWKIL